MPIDVQCAGSGAKFEAPEKFAGKRVKCPKCSAVITVGGRPPRPSGPAAPAKDQMTVIPAACRCGKQFRVKAELVGKHVKCPACGQAFTVADVQPASAQPDGELDLGQLAGVEEAAATTLGAPLSQVKKKEQRANTRLIVALRDTTVAIHLEPRPPHELQAYLRAEAILRGTKCLVALRRWQSEHPHPPADLATLTRSAGMETFPADPYTDQPLRITTMMGWPVIYSVGPDGKDDRARKAEFDRNSKGWRGDFVFRLETPN